MGLQPFKLFVAKMVKGLQYITFFKEEFWQGLTFVAFCVIPLQLQLVLQGSEGSPASHSPLLTLPPSYLAMSCQGVLVQLPLQKPLQEGDNSHCCHVQFQLCWTQVSVYQLMSKTRLLLLCGGLMASKDPGGIKLLPMGLCSCPGSAEHPLLLLATLLLSFTHKPIDGAGQLGSLPPNY